MIYFFVFIYLLICVIIYDIYEKKSYLKTNYITLFFFFTFIAGLRWRLGVDTVNYMNDFQYDILPLSRLTVGDIIESKLQPFWIILNAFCKSLGNFIFLQIFVSLFFHFSVFYFLYKTCMKPFTALVIYFIYNYFYFSMEIMRESLSISCFLFGIIALDNEKIVKYYMWSLCAFMFHFFSIFLFFVPLLLSEKCSLKNKLLIMVILLVVWFVFKIELLTIIVGIVPPVIGERLMGYFLVDRYTSNVWRITGFLYHLFPLVIMMIFTYLYSAGKCNSLFKIKTSLWHSCIMIYIVLLILSTDMAILLRFSNYMYMIAIILYSSCLYVIRFKQTSQVIFISICFLSMLGLRIYMLSRSERVFTDYKLHIHQYAEYYPYTSVFCKEEPLERKILHSYWGDQ